MEAMDRTRRSSRSAEFSSAIAALAFAVSLLAAYPSAYLAMGERSSFESPDGKRVIVRSFSQQWQIIVFQPAARLEALMRSANVVIKGDWEHGGII